MKARPRVRGLVVLAITLVQSDIPGKNRVELFCNSLANGLATGSSARERPLVFLSTHLGVCAILCNFMRIRVAIFSWNIKYRSCHVRSIRRHLQMYNTFKTL